MLVVLVACLSASAGILVVDDTLRAVGEFRVKGPFAIGKDEVDATASEGLSELGRQPKWRVVRTGGDGVAMVSFDVDWSGVVQGVGMAALEWQAAVVARLEVRHAATVVGIRCSGLASYSVGPNLFAGDVYFAPQGGLFGDGFGVAKLEPGTHELRGRLRARRAGRLRCLARELATPTFAVAPLIVPDRRPDGFVGLWASVVVTNAGLDWLHVNATGPLSGEALLAPGQRAAARLRLAPDAPCGRRFKASIISAAAKKEEVTLDIACREVTQSTLMTFLDWDGSVQHAALVGPERRPDLPVVLALHGTSVHARDSADAFKRQSDTNGRMVFGVDGAYLLAPSRHGAHNWEGVGLRHAVRALDALNVWRGGARRDDRVVIVGHSMGAHGALLLGQSLLPGARGVAAVAPWLRKQTYGDSNVRWFLDATIADPATRMVMDASLAEQDADAAVENMCGLRVLVRAGDRDQAVHPWYARRAARLVAGACGGVDWEEVPGKEHWWWDTKTPNDGGAVNDETMRGFFRQALAAGAPACAPGTTLVVSNPATILGFNACGYRVIAQRVPLVRRSIVRHVADGVLETTNVARLAIANTSARRAIVDGARVVLFSDRDVCWTPGESWAACEIARPTFAGPMRRVVEETFVVLGGDEVDLAVYVANHFHATGRARAPVVRRWDDVPPGSNVVVLGALLDVPFVVSKNNNESKISFGGCEWRGDDDAVAAVVPLGNELLKNNLALVLHANTRAALKGLVELLATPTIPPMARQPFSGALPDVLVLDVERTKATGAGGFMLAGYWENPYRFTLSDAATAVPGPCPSRRLLRPDDDDVCE